MTLLEEVGYPFHLVGLTSCHGVGVYNHTHVSRDMLDMVSTIQKKEALKLLIMIKII